MHIPLTSASLISLFCTAFLWDLVKWPLKYLKLHKNSAGVTILCFSNTHLEGANTCMETSS